MVEIENGPDLSPSGARLLALPPEDEKLDESDRPR
jgi:hypothetical protein